MPWRESSVMEERLRFVAQVLDGEPMSDVCRAFGISRKTGYKLFKRYQEHGLEALSARVKVSAPEFAICSSFEFLSKLNFSELP